MVVKDIREVTCEGRVGVGEKKGAIAGVKVCVKVCVSVVCILYPPTF